MELLQQALDWVLHLDKHLREIVDYFGAWSYVIFFGVVFIETGVVIMPFLPGDSLLFGAGAIAGMGLLDPWILSGTLIASAIVGDNANYWLGRTIGKRFLGKPNARILKKQHLDRTHAFFEKYGTWAIVLARFMPLIRTFMPFVAGIARMNYGAFLPFDILGAFIWVGVCVPAGYFFGQMPIVKENFSLVVLAIIAVSLIPAAIGGYFAWRDQRKARAAGLNSGTQPTSVE